MPPRALCAPAKVGKVELTGIVENNSIVQRRFGLGPGS